MSLPRTRLIPACAPGHECSDEEINEIFIELLDIRNDPTIKEYSFPTVVEMEEILDTADAYDGEWYHSDVTITAREQLTDEQKNSDEFMTLYDKLTDKNIQEKGVFLSTSYDVDLPFMKDSYPNTIGG